MHANASLDEIVAFLDRLLDVEKYAAEEGSNGLIVRGSTGVTKFAAAVNTSLATIYGAAKAGAQLLVVHHTTWPGIDLHLRDEKIAALQAAGVSLYASHAALDCAPRIGNSRVLADALELRWDEGEAFGEFFGGFAGMMCTSSGTFGDFVARCSRVLGVQVEAHQHAKTFGRVAIVPGGAGETSWLDQARQRGADTYLTGEGSMYTRMFARETGMNLVLGTHHATEAPGIKALAERLAAESQLPWEFIPDSPDVF